MPILILSFFGVLFIVAVIVLIKSPSIRGILKKGLKVAMESMNLVIVLFVFGAVWSVLNVFLAPRLQTPGGAPPGVAIVLGILFALASFFMQAGSLGYVRDTLKLGKAEFSSFTASGSKYYVPFLLLSLFIALVVGAFIIAAAAIAAVLANISGMLGLVLAVIVAAIGVYAAILMLLAPYFIVAGGQGVIASVKSSVSLVRKNLLKLLGIALILAVIGFLTGGVLGLFFALLNTAMKGVQAPQFIFAVLSSFVNAFLGVVVTGSLMTFYLETSNNNTSGAN